MTQLQNEAIRIMIDAFERMEVAIVPPVRVPLRDSFVFRYDNKGIHEALIQKLARYLSGLNAINSLLVSGYIQEIGVLQRTLDEIQEDIFFLATAETNGARTDRHTQYLEAFYADAVTAKPEGAIEIPKPNLVPRKKIRAHTMNTLGQGIDAAQALVAGEGVGTAYSGYVHAASENIMDMYGGERPHYHLQGMVGTPRIQETIEANENHVYRGLMATIISAKAFGGAELVKELYEFLDQYEVANGHKPAK